MVNVFIHFEPIGPIGGQVEYTGQLPPYLIEGSPAEEIRWDENPDGHQYLNQQFTTGSTELHTQAANADVQQIQWILDTHEHLVMVGPRYMRPYGMGIGPL
jgi:hypothetical protein